MRNGMYHENQYLESDLFDLETDHEDYEIVDHEGDFEDFEDFEDMEVYEDMEDYEGDQFIGKALKRFVKPLAVQAAGALGSKLLGPQGGRLAQSIASRVLREAEAEGDFEGESEAEFEAEFEAAGGQMQLLYEVADAAANAETDQEADMFLGALANIAGAVIPKLLGETDQEDYEDMEGDQFLPLAGIAATLLPKAVPLLGKGIKAIGSFFRRKRSRRAIRKLAPAAARTAVQVANRIKSGKSITPRYVVGSLAGNVARQFTPAASRPTPAARRAQQIKRAQVTMRTRRA
jgi:hypothetical protein